MSTNPDPAPAPAPQAAPPAATTTPAPAPSPEASPALTMLTLLRQSVAGACFFLAVLFLITALYPVVRSLPMKEYWAYPVWGGLMALGTVVAGGLLLMRRSDTV